MQVDDVLTILMRTFFREKEDMLDLAWGLTDTSRLGCQVKVKADMNNIEVRIPEED